MYTANEDIDEEIDEEYLLFKIREFDKNRKKLKKFVKRNIKEKRAEETLVLYENPPLWLANFAEKQVINKNAAELRIKDVLDKHHIIFEYQKPIGRFIPDFYLPKYKIVLEVDGLYHTMRRGKDRARDRWFKKHGMRTVRLPTQDVAIVEKLSKQVFLTCLVKRSSPGRLFAVPRVL